ncbi:MAG: DNA polymerase III subunit delta' [Actinomycetaceae bacterium]|nr:DNA polymerase III subunit delta' [Actinomycetaceae bacterium]
MSVWDALVGQAPAVATLQAAVRGAQQLLAVGVGSTKGECPNFFEGDGLAAMSHAWLITGPPGSGRSLAAYAFAAALQCQQGGCGQCEACLQSLEGTHPDVRPLHTDKVVITIEEARQMIGVAYQAPSQGRWRVIIVEDADRMAERTANVLLKAIEEPPPQTVWILCAPSEADMISTIRSRCRTLNLRVPPVRDVAELLVRRDGVDPQIAMSVARAAQAHIGRARALALDPDARARRDRKVATLAGVRSVADAVYGAQQVLKIAEDDATVTSEAANEDAAARVRKMLGLKPEEAFPKHFAAHRKQLEEEAKRRSTRALRDQLDLCLVDLLAFYRDVYARQIGADVDLINDTLVGEIAEQAELTSREQSVSRMQAVQTARRRIGANVPPLLVLEALCMELRPGAKPHPWKELA